MQRWNGVNRGEPQQVGRVGGNGGLRRALGVVLAGIVAVGTTVGAQQECNDGLDSVAASTAVQGKIRCGAALIRGPGPVLNFCPKTIVFEPAYDRRVDDEGSGKRAILAEYRPIVAVDYTCRHHFFLYFFHYATRCEPKRTTVVGLRDHMKLQGC